MKRRACGRSRLRSLGALVLLLLLPLAAQGCRANGTAGTPAGGGGGGRGGRGGRGGGGGAQPVVIARVSQQDVPVEIVAVGNVEAYATISVKSQVTGQLQQAFFHEGDVVRKGDRLFRIDPRPLEASLKQAEATLVRDEALLNQAEAQVARDSANAHYQELTSERQGKLAARGLVSLDASEQSRAAAEATLGTLKADRAAYESAKAQLVMQQSVVENAKVQLSYTDIRATIDGRTGSNTVKPGNLVSANSTELVTVTQLQPVYVTFAVPAVHLPTVKEHLGKDPLLVVAAPPDAGGRPIEGHLTFVDNAVDQASDTIKLKATFPNTDLRLWPGQFTRVTLRLATLPSATVVPSQAVQTGQEGQFVFVVKQDSTVEVRPVTVARRMGETVVVGKGLTPGERIVTEGQLRLEQGTRIQAADSAGRATGGAAGRGGRGRGGRGQGAGQGQGGPGQSGAGQGAPGQGGEGRGQGQGGGARGGQGRQGAQ
jgi:membrane fusion protein, multidrug efflux system